MGDVVTIKNGFGRNFLLPRGKAIRASKHNLQVFEQRKLVLVEENMVRKQQAEAVLEKLAGAEVKVFRQAGEDGRLFGSVSSRDIVNYLKSSHEVAIDHVHVIINEKFKQIGDYDVTIELHPEVIATVKLVIARGDAENFVS
jgi:large subunit ribosomal protein L9